MKSVKNIGLKDVQAVYSGPEGVLWELVMGQQVHIGGFQSSMDLAEKAGIGPGTSGVDLCCCNGAGMRFLVRFRKVARMQGVDATETVVESGRRRCEEEGHDGRQPQFDRHGRETDRHLPADTHRRLYNALPRLQHVYGELPVTAG